MVAVAVVVAVAVAVVVGVAVAVVVGVAVAVAGAGVVAVAVAGAGVVGVAVAVVVGVAVAVVVGVGVARWHMSDGDFVARCSCGRELMEVQGAANHFLSWNYRHAVGGLTLTCPPCGRDWVLGGHLQPEDWPQS